MKGVRVPRAQGEHIRLRLLEEGVLRTGYRIFADDGHLYMPVFEDVEGLEMVDVEFEPLPRERTYREQLKSVLPEALVDEVHTFDAIGDIAVLDIQDELLPFAQDIGAALLASHKHFNVVLGKGGALEGDYRTRRFIHLAGEERTYTVHKEHGLELEVDLAKVFFSPRLATERKRVAEQVREGEVVIDMFCGVGPFALFIAKRAHPEIVYAIDLNPDAIDLLNANILRNKVTCIEPLCGDAAEMVRKLPAADRIVMNLPHEAHAFLDTAFDALAPEGTIHYYAIVNDGQEEMHEQVINEKAEAKGKRAIIRNTRRVKPYAPLSHMRVYDIKLV
ncbi:class I SAM-dependent methyltransferase family protein [archaeon]|nr:MAG: class I SAM-dependent methyltransferase family protein [archaeon]